VKAAVRAGVSEQDAPAVAAGLTRQASTWQLVELMSLAARYAHDQRYRNPPTPIMDNLYYCCAQKTGSQWLKQILIDPAFFQATGLKVLPYVALGMKFARLDQAVPPHTVLTHLYAGYDAYAAIPKPARFKTFYIVRDPRNAVVSWYSCREMASRRRGSAAPNPPHRAEGGYGLSLCISNSTRRFGRDQTRSSWRSAPRRHRRQRRAKCVVTTRVPRAPRRACVPFRVTTVS
jgi:hypothetical protein